MKTRMMICALCVLALCLVGCSGGKEAVTDRVRNPQPAGSVQPVRLTLDSTIQIRGPLKSRRLNGARIQCQGSWAIWLGSA